MLPFVRMLEYGNVVQIPAPLVYLPMNDDFTNHGDSTNPLYGTVNLTVTTATHGTVAGRTGLVCNGSQRIYYDELVYANTSWTACNWVYTTSTNAKAYINASANVGFSYNTGGSPSVVRNFYCVNSGSTTNSYFGQVGMPVNQWVHVVYSYDRPTNTLRFYYNGVLSRTVTVSPRFTGYGNGTGTPRQVGLGYYPGNVTATPLNGYISHHRLYLSVLTDNEIQRIYNYELGGNV